MMEQQKTSKKPNAEQGCAKCWPLEYGDLFQKKEVLGVGSHHGGLTVGKTLTCAKCLLLRYGELSERKKEWPVTSHLEHKNA